jgi:hypothetical protein
MTQVEVPIGLTTPTKLFYNWRGLLWFFRVDWNELRSAVI